MGKLLQFLFGKPAQIFNKKGSVQHDLGKKKWNNWSDRFTKDPNYDYTKHVGQTRRKEQKN